jgi:hypothetical protein
LLLPSLPPLLPCGTAMAASDGLTLLLRVAPLPDAPPPGTTSAHGRLCDPLPAWPAACFSPVAGRSSQRTLHLWQQHGTAHTTASITASGSPARRPSERVELKAYIYLLVPEGLPSSVRLADKQSAPEVKALRVQHDTSQDTYKYFVTANYVNVCSRRSRQYSTLDRHSHWLDACHRSLQYNTTLAVLQL